MDFRFYLDRSFKRRLDAATRAFPGEIQSAVKRATVFVFERVREKTPVSYGNLKKSISANVSRFRGVVAPTVKYGSFVHEGTQPHWVPKKEWTDPSGSIYLWAKRKGLNPYLVARAISRKGTKKQPWMRETFSTYERYVKNFFEDAVNGALKKF